MAKHPEYHDQVALVDWFKVQYPRYAKLLRASTDGAHVGGKTGHFLQRMGAQADYPDLHLYVPTSTPRETIVIGQYGPRVVNVIRYCPGLLIEMKAKKTGRLRSGQAQLHALLKEQGYDVRVCWGWDQAREAIQHYMKGVL